jgi:hypothetical protein
VMHACQEYPPPLASAATRVKIVGLITTRTD